MSGFIVATRGVFDRPQGEQLSPGARFEELFFEVPLFGGREWETRSVDELVVIFREALDDMKERIDQAKTKVEHERETAIRTHQAKFVLWRWISSLWFRPVEVPNFPDREAVKHNMYVRAQRLAAWMESNASRPFYAGSDMSAYIDKPRAVARKFASS